MRRSAMRSFARTWSSDLKGRNSRVNAVSPGVIETPGHEKVSIQSVEREQFFAHAFSITPLGRVGTDDEVAKVVCHVAAN
jgi:NAD(P)-dependent dehydrogenase (short-subunit alcohol dehydrogenase family)